MGNRGTDQPRSLALDALFTDGVVSPIYVFPSHVFPFHQLNSQHPPRLNYGYRFQSHRGMFSIVNATNAGNITDPISAFSVITYNVPWQRTIANSPSRILSKQNSHVTAGGTSYSRCCPHHLWVVFRCTNATSLFSKFLGLWRVFPAVLLSLPAH